jgi:hypothetical protein
MPRTRLAGAIAAAAILVALSARPSLCADPIPKGETPAPNAVDTGHAGASERVRQLGAWIDRFFTDENYEAEINKSWLRIRVDSFSELYEGTDVEARVRLHLKLPSVNKRLRFEISSSGEPDDFDGANSDTVGSRPPGAAEGKSSAAVAYVFRALKERSIIARVGWDFDGYDPNPFVGARYRELVSLNGVSKRRLEFSIYRESPLLHARWAGIAYNVRLGAHPGRRYAVSNQRERYLA